MNQILNRIKLPTPSFWKKVGNYCMATGVILTIVAERLSTSYPDLSSILLGIGGTLIAIVKPLTLLTVEGDYQSLITKNDAKR